MISLFDNNAGVGARVQCLLNVSVRVCVPFKSLTSWLFVRRFVGWVYARVRVCGRFCLSVFIPRRKNLTHSTENKFRSLLCRVTASPGLSGTSPTNFQSPSCFIFKEVNPWGDIPGDCKKISGARSWVCLRILVFDGRVNRFESSYRSNFATDRSHVTNLRSMNLQFFCLQTFFQSSVYSSSDSQCDLSASSPGKGTCQRSHVAVGSSFPPLAHRPLVDSALLKYFYDAKNLNFLL